MEFKKTSLWQKSLGEAADKQFEVELERLRSEMAGFRERAEILTSRIAAALPSLTVHNVSHLDALWEIASLICGDDYPLNPLEGFVLGGAILLHDAALCFEAYDHGQVGVRETSAWKDAYVAELEQNPEATANWLEAEADFFAVRELHAKQAEILARKDWVDPDTKEARYLIENIDLRKHLGPLIGKIAASHHWDIEDLFSKLPRQVNAPANFPRVWRINPLKIGCILRCADALHIDGRRAPDFAYALLRKRGISRKHWQAQNKIGRIDIDLSDSLGSTILITSTNPFLEDDSASWWIAYDLACVANREIQAANSLLEEPGALAPAFKIKRIKGVESPDSMSIFIRAEGWAPCAASVHVSDTESLVRGLGGHHLYGDSNNSLAVVLRELIQNARDAVKAREALDSRFRGKVVVRLIRSGETTIEIEDDGVGMSKRVLVGPLLDFGTSFWTSSLVHSEFPGLRSSGFKSVGKFGVGFYSVFMVSDCVRVSTRRWNEGLNTVYQLRFKKGNFSRPLLKQGEASELGLQFCTKIEVNLNKETIPADGMILINPQMTRSKTFAVPFLAYLSRIVVGLDVDVALEENGKESIVHARQPIADGDRLNWLRRISFASYQGDPQIDQYISANFLRLRPIIDRGRCFGLAALSTIPSGCINFLNVDSVGGLTNMMSAQNANFHIGFIDRKPISAKREAGGYAASSEVMSAWALEQFQLLCTSGCSPIERCVAAYSLAHFGVDPTPIALIAFWIKGLQQFLTFDQAAELAINLPLVFLKSSLGNYIDGFHRIREIGDSALFITSGAGEFNNVEFVGDIPKDEISVISCLHKVILAKGFVPSWTFHEGAVEGSFAPMHVISLVASRR